MDYQGIFLDDREQDAYLTEYMSSNERDSLTVEFLKADKTLEDQANSILDQNPDMVALDFRLSDQQDPSDVGLRYKAGPLAQQLRDYSLEHPAADFPVVLVSADEVKTHGYDPDLTTHDLFDRVYIKEHLVQSSYEVKRELLALAVGYRVFRNRWQEGVLLDQVLNADDGEYLLEGQEFRKIFSVNAPHQMSRVILRNIILRNGILLDKLGLLAILGVSPGSLNTDSVFNYFLEAGAGYTGVFHEGWPRWWRYRIEAHFLEITGNTLGNLSSKDRVQLLSDVIGKELEYASSRWLKTDVVFPAFPCASCGHPTERKHSVAAYDEAPSFVEKRRICWACIEDGVYETRGLEVNDSDLLIREKIENGDLSSEV